MASAFPAVAARSGVSPATIYRYFPDRESLLEGAAYGHVDTGLRAGGPEISLTEYRDVARKIFEAHENDLAAVIAGHSTPAGRAMRQTRAANREAQKCFNRHPVISSPTDTRDYLVQRFVGMEHEVFCEIVDISSLLPLDVGPVAESVNRTGALVTLHRPVEMDRW